MQKIIGFIGFGEASSTFAGEIAKKIQGTKIVAYDKFVNERTLQLAKSTDTTLLNSIEELVDTCPVIISMVTGSVAVSVAKSVVDLLKEGQLYIDFNSVSPKTKQEIAKVINSANKICVDAAVMGSVPELKLQVPILLAGSHAQNADEYLKQFGFNTSVVGDNAGDAAAIKMVRSVFAKGLEGLFVEMLLAAKEYGVSEYVINSVSKSLEGKKIRDVMNTLVVSQAYHSARKKGEMDFVIEVLNDVNVKPIMTTASRDTFKWLSELGLKEKINPDTATYNDIINAINELQN